MSWRKLFLEDEDEVEIGADMSNHVKCGDFSETGPDFIYVCGSDFAPFQLARNLYLCELPFNDPELKFWAEVCIRSHF